MEDTNCIARRSHCPCKLLMPLAKGMTRQTKLRYLKEYPNLEIVYEARGSSARVTVSGTLILTLTNVGVRWAMF